MRRLGLFASPGTASAVPSWPLEQDRDRVLEIDDIDEFALEIRMLLSERSPRAGEVAL